MLRQSESKIRENIEKSLQLLEQSNVELDRAIELIEDRACLDAIKQIKRTVAQASSTIRGSYTRQPAAVSSFGKKKVQTTTSVTQS